MKTYGNLSKKKNDELVKAVNDKPMLAVSIKNGVTLDRRKEVLGWK